MKDQTNLIISIVCGVLAIGVAIACYATKREPASPAPAPKVITTAVALPAATVSYTNGLSGGSGGAGGGGRSGFGGGPMMGGMSAPGGGGRPSMGGMAAPGGGGRRGPMSSG